MIAAVVAMGAVTVLLAAALVVALRDRAAERHEWVAERRSLIDRVIANHTGEVIALDRNQRPRTETPERPQAVGMG